MKRRSLLSVFWLLAFWRRLRAQAQGKPVNEDEHGDMPNMAAPALGQGQANLDRPSQALLAQGTAAAPAGRVLPVLTRSYDNLRSCANAREAILTPELLAANGLRKLFSVALPGDGRGLESQPLLLSAVRVADGTVHDLLLSTTMGNQVYAHDANDGTPLWMMRVGGPPIPGSREIDSWLVNDRWGILSTGAIDAAAGLLYCVSWSGGDWRTAAHKVHAISLASGREARLPLDLSRASYEPGHGLPTQQFAQSQRKQRASLLLATVGGRKTLFIPFGTIQETSAAARGWIVAVDLASWTVAAAWTAASRYSGGGIWQAGQGIAADADGYLYCVTGNGSFDAITEWGECYLKFRYTPPATPTPGTGKLEVIDWWSPWTDSGRAGGDPAGTHVTAQVRGGWDDQDLGSGGIAVIPELGLVLGCGKDGILYVMDWRRMGRTQPADFANSAANYAKLKHPPIWFTYYSPRDPAPANPAELNFLEYNRTHHLHSTPVVWKAADGWRLYCWGENSNLRAWSIDASGQARYLGCGQEVASEQSPVPPGGMPGGMLCLSSNGGRDGILWATCPDGDANRAITTGRLLAYDAFNLGKYPDGSGSLRLLWRSAPFIFNKFCPPVVSGGRVYLPTYDARVDVYG